MNFINSSDPRNPFETQDPSSGKTLKTYSHASAAEINQVLKLAGQAHLRWQRSSLAERSRAFEALATLLSESSMDIAQAMKFEMGKTLKEGQAEVQKSAAALSYFSKNLESFFVRKKFSDSDLKAEIRWDSIGTVLAIMPWNFPLWQTVRAFLPIVAVGNSFVLKPSDLVPETTKIFSSIFNTVLPEGVYSHLLLSHAQAADIIRDPRISAVTMTGSSRGGKEVGRVAGENLKKVVLELGGSDPYLVLEDADLARSAELCAQSRMINAGQSCICAKRFLVPKSRLEEWLGYFKNTLERLQKDMAPLAHVKFRSQLQDQTRKIQAEGGKLYWKGEFSESYKLSQDTAFFAPEIWLISGQEKFHRTEEFFGPVALVIPYEDLEQAIEIANGTIYGLGAAVFSKNLKIAEEVGLRLRSGLLALNDFNRSDVRLPFGGVQSSGFGRELGPWPLFEFANLRAITGI